MGVLFEESRNTVYFHIMTPGKGQTVGVTVKMHLSGSATNSSLLMLHSPDIALSVYLLQDIINTLLTI